MLTVWLASSICMFCFGMSQMFSLNLWGKVGIISSSTKTQHDTQRLSPPPTFMLQQNTPAQMWYEQQEVQTSQLLRSDFRKPKKPGNSVDYSDSCSQLSGFTSFLRNRQNSLNFGSKLIYAVAVDVTSSVCNLMNDGHDHLMWDMRMLLTVLTV